MDLARQRLERPRRRPAARAGAPARARRPGRAGRASHDGGRRAARRAMRDDQQQVDQPRHRGPGAGSAAADLAREQLDDRGHVATVRRIGRGRAGPSAAATSAAARPRGRRSSRAQASVVTAPVPPISSSPRGLDVRRAFHGQRPSSSCAARPSGSSTRSPGISWIGSCSGTHIHAVPDGDGMKRRAVALRRARGPSGALARTLASSAPRTRARSRTSASGSMQTLSGQEYAMLKPLDAHRGETYGCSP